MVMYAGKDDISSSHGSPDPAGEDSKTYTQ